jgi:hypothetical protein
VVTSIEGSATAHANRRSMRDVAVCWASLAFATKQVRVAVRLVGSNAESALGPAPAVGAGITRRPLWTTTLRIRFARDGPQSESNRPSGARLSVYAKFRCWAGAAQRHRPR